jgi:putative peptidoglycan lipid II flippase
MERVIGVLRKPVSNVGEAAFLLGLFTFVSQLLGLLRDHLLASVFGAGKDLDIYYAAFRFPDLIFVTVGSLVAMSVLIPYLSDAKNKGTEFFDTLVSDLFLCFSFAIILVCAVVFFILPALIAHAFSGFSTSDIEKVIMLSRIILLSPILLGFSNLLGSVAQVHGRFISYAIAPALYNLGIIVGTLFLVPHFGVFGVAAGVVVGAFLHVSIQGISLKGLVSIRELLKFREKLSIAFGRIRKIVLISIPRTIALSSSNLALLGLLAIGSFLGAGAISSFTFGNNLQSVTVSIIGVSFAMAAFPVLSNLFRAGEMDKMRQELINTARKIIFFTVPAACFLIVFRAHLVRLILGSGHFSWDDTRLVAASLAIFAISLSFQSLYHLFIRTLYAVGDNKKSFYSSISGAISMIVVAYFWHKWSTISSTPSTILNSLLKVTDVPGTEMLALPLGFVFGAIVECMLLWVIVERKIHFTKDILKPIFHSLGAGMIGAASSYMVLQYTGKFFTLDKFVGLLMHAFIGGVVGIAVAVATLVLLENEEIKVILHSFTRKLSGIKPMAADTDVLS